MYPKLKINLKKLGENSRIISNLCKEEGIEVTGVIKGCNGFLPVADQMYKSGIRSLASSRMAQLKRIREAGMICQTMLLRLPMSGEVTEMVKWVDISLNSEKSILEAINKACKNQGLIHKAILMYDLGDLREGIWKLEDMVDLSLYIEHHLPCVELYGIGTNVGCYGSIKPTVQNMTELVGVAEAIECAIGRKLDIISGGATSSLTMVYEKQMPSRINHLRVGEAILLSRDLIDYFEVDMKGIHYDGFKLEAEIVEIQEKPSYPVGEQFIDAFGNKPMFADRGVRRRAILAVGRQDFGDHTKLILDEEFGRVIGSSSDHLIVDISDAEVTFSVGDVMSFELYYQAMLFLSICEDVKKDFVL